MALSITSTHLIARSSMIISGFLWATWANAAHAQLAAGAPAAPAATADAPPASPKPAEPGYLGLVTDDRQESGHGVRVSEALAGAPAAKGGLAAGDLITGVNGKAVHSNSDMISIVGSLPPGSEVTFDVDRSGQKQQVKVVLGTRPTAAERRFEQFGPVGGQDEALPPPSTLQNPPASTGPTIGDTRPLTTTPRSTELPSVPRATTALPPTYGGPRPVPRAGATTTPLLETPRKALLGLRTVSVPAELRQRFRLAPTGGALVAARTPGTPADRAGIPVDSVIVEFNGAPVDSPLDLARLVSEAGRGAEVEIVYIADGDTKRTKVVLDDAAGGRAAPPKPTPQVPLSPPPPTNVGEAPAVGPTPAAPNDRTDIDALKRRIDELEQRVKELEQAAKK